MHLGFLPSQLAQVGGWVIGWTGLNWLDGTYIVMTRNNLSIIWISIISSFIIKKGTSLVEISTIKYHVEQLWKEFHLPIWITEFDWNADGSVDFGDHSIHAEQLQNFYRLMFSLEVCNYLWNFILF